MAKLLLMTLVALLALAACSDSTPSLTVVPTPTPQTRAITAPDNLPKAPTETPTAVPTSTPAASSPTPEPTATPAALGLLAPLQVLDSFVLLSELPANELACVGDNPEKLARSLAGTGSAPREEQTKFIGCLDDETLARIFLAGFLPGPGPLSQETSDCVRAGFAVIDPRTVMTAGIDGDPGRAMAGSMTGLFVTITCLNDEEWYAAASRLGMRPDERVGMRCLLDELGGPGEMAEAMQAAGEGDSTNLTQAAIDCGLDMGPVPGQPPASPPSNPTPTVTVQAPTPSITPKTTLIITVALTREGIPEYNRAEWKHWTDADGDCQDGTPGRKS